MQPDTHREDAPTVVGWNGVRLALPQGWDPSGISPSSLVFAQEGRPALTLRWEAMGTGRIRSGIARVRRSFPRELRHTLRDAPLPDPWRQALEGRFAEEDLDDARAFAWGGPAEGGEGLLIGSRGTRRLFLLHFHRIGGAANAGRIPLILSSFRDGAVGGRVLWAVYDIRAELPEALRLARHRFMPGAFELVFRSGAGTVRLFRWGPASVLLRSGTLADFAAARLALPQDRVETEGRSGADAVRWIDRRPSPRWLPRPLRGLTTRPARQGRAWHLPRENRILAVEIEARTLPPEEVLNGLCRSFGCLPSGDYEPSPEP